MGGRRIIKMQKMPAATINWLLLWRDTKARAQCCKCLQATLSPSAFGNVGWGANFKKPLPDNGLADSIQVNS
jgi:hypothetical protein